MISNITPFKSKQNSKQLLHQYAVVIGKVCFFSGMAPSSASAVWKPCQQAVTVEGTATNLSHKWTDWVTTRECTKEYDIKQSKDRG